MSTCISKLHPLQGFNHYAENQVATFHELEQNLVTFYTQLIAKASKATIRVMGYPKIMQRYDGCRCGEVGWSNDESDWIDGIITELDNRVSTALTTAISISTANSNTNTDVDIKFVPVTDYFTTGACVG